MKKIMAKKSSLRLLSCIMAFCMCITVFAGTVGFYAAAETTNVWDGKTDTYADMTALLADLGAADSDGYYHIKTPNQLHAAIKFQGGGNKYKLDNDIYLNEDYENYETWGTTAPANNWWFQNTNAWTSKTPFTGTIDGCGYTVYGLYSSSGGAYSGLIREVKGVTTIENLNVSHAFLDANGNKSWKDLRAGTIVGWANGAELTVEGCSVRNVFIAGGNENDAACGGIVSTSKNSTVRISNCAVTNVEFTSRVAYSQAHTKNVAYPFGSFIGGIYENMQATENTGTLAKVQAQKNIIENSYAVDVVNSTAQNTPVYVCGLHYKDTKWGYSITANNVYTDATEVPVSANGTSVKLLVSTDAETAIDPTDANYPIKAITADGIKGDAAINAMPMLNWAKWTVSPNGYPYYEDKDIVWDGTDTYTDMTALLTELGAADSEGYYHIKTPNQLHAAIRFQGGGNKFKLDNDLYLNSDYGNYENWKTTSPENVWHFNQGSTWDVNKMTPFTGTIDGCGYTIYGLYSNTNGNYNGLIGAVTGETVIKNLNVKYGYLNAANRAGVIVGYKTNSGTLTIDGCSVSDLYIAGGWQNVPAGGMLGLTAGGKTTIENCAVNDVNFSSKNPASWGVGDNFNRYPYGSFIGSIYIDMQLPANTAALNHTQADNNVIKNSYALNVKNISNNNELVHICGLFYEGNGEKWGYSVTATDVYTDATAVPESTNTDPVVKLLISDDTWKINNTIKTPETDNFEGLFSNGHWYRGAAEGSMPIQKSQTANFAYLDITGEGVDDAYDSIDLTYLRKHLLGLEDYKYILADLNGDGENNIIDLVRLKKNISNFQ